MANGYRIIAEIGRVDGKEPEICISDQNFKAVKAQDGTLYIVSKESEKYCPLT